MVHLVQRVLPALVDVKVLALALGLMVYPSCFQKRLVLMMVVKGLEVLG